MRHVTTMAEMLDDAFDNCFGCGDVPEDILEDLFNDKTLLRRIGSVKIRYTVEMIECDHKDVLSRNERRYKIKDLKTGKLGFASYKTEADAQARVDKKNGVADVGS